MARKSISNSKLKQIVERDGSASCHYCLKLGDSKVFTGTTGRASWLWIEHEIDHVIPLSVGGTDEVENLVIACRDCNSKKRAKLEWSYGS